jgi:hypothetical protein
MCGTSNRSERLRHMRKIEKKPARIRLCMQGSDNQEVPILVVV